MLASNDTVSLCRRRIPAAGQPNRRNNGARNTVTVGVGETPMHELLYCKILYTGPAEATLIQYTVVLHVYYIYKTRLWWHCSHKTNEQTQFTGVTQFGIWKHCIQTGTIVTICTLSKAIDFPRYNMKCSGENEIPRRIFQAVSRFPLHFMLYRGNLDYFVDSVLCRLLPQLRPWPVYTGTSGHMPACVGWY